MSDLTPRILEVVARLKGDDPPALATPDLAAERARVLAYQVACRRWWGLTATGPEADRQAIADTWQTLVKLRDEVGEPAATELHRRWARAWHQETGRCPWCGEAGLYHDPERDGEPAER